METWWFATPKGIEEVQVQHATKYQVVVVTEGGGLVRRPQDAQRAYYRPTREEAKAAIVAEAKRFIAGAEFNLKLKRHELAEVEKL